MQIASFWRMLGGGVGRGGVGRGGPLVPALGPPHPPPHPAEQLQRIANFLHFHLEIRRVARLEVGPVGPVFDFGCAMDAAAQRPRRPPPPLPSPSAGRNVEPLVRRYQIIPVGKEDCRPASEGEESCEFGAGRCAGWELASVCRSKYRVIESRRSSPK